MVSLKLKAFYSPYENVNYIVWDEFNELVTDYTILRNGIELFSGTKDDFMRPEVFDRDHHTNLFRKLSAHERAYIDSDIEHFADYSYTAIAKIIGDGGAEWDRGQSNTITVHTT